MYEDYVKQHVVGVYRVSGLEEHSLEIVDGEIEHVELLTADYDIISLEYYICDICPSEQIQDPKKHWSEYHENNS